MEQDLQRWSVWDWAIKQESYRDGAMEIDGAMGLHPRGSTHTAPHSQAELSAGNSMWAHLTEALGQRLAEKHSKTFFHRFFRLIECHSTVSLPMGNQFTALKDKQTPHSFSLLLCPIFSSSSLALLKHATLINIRGQILGWALISRQLLSLLFLKNCV